MKYRTNSAAALIYPSLEYHMSGMLWGLRMGNSFAPAVCIHVTMLRRLLRRFRVVVKGQACSGSARAQVRREIMTVSRELSDLEALLHNAQVPWLEGRSRVCRCIAELEQLVSLSDQVDLQDLITLHDGA